MLGLVLGGTTLQLFIFWELVGLCSYLLIGFWYEKKSASNAAIKAFVTNRVGDFGFLIGFGILFYHLGNVTLPNMWVAFQGAGTNNGTDALNIVGGGTITAGLLTAMGIGLFFGAVGKSAQFPLHVWLPDAMEGPTPVSALIHAATMVAAGVYHAYNGRAHRAGADRHQEGSRVFDALAVGLHDPGPGDRQLHRRTVPPHHARFL
jgi:NADH:ubiquinone oxidoreductase subunit 5 (subunit L)/multisubunit Na+/H+ antiporter MnhA subunit